MNDNGYAAALVQQLDGLTEELKVSRDEQDRSQKLVEHLKAEQHSLRQQKEQRKKRQELLLTVSLLRKQLHAKQTQLQQLEQSQLREGQPIKTLQEEAKALKEFIRRVRTEGQVNGRLITEDEFHKITSEGIVSCFGSVTQQATYR